MYEHRCGSLYCPICISERTFSAVMLDGRPVDRTGKPVRHIADAFCRECGFSFGRSDVRDETTGHVRRDIPLVSDADAADAARRLGLPLQAALFGDAVRFLELEALAEASAVAPAAAEPAAGDDLDRFLAQAARA